MKLTARIMVWRESLTPLCDFQLLTPLSTQQVETPRALRHRGRAVVLTHLAEERRIKYKQETSAKFKVNLDLLAVLDWVFLSYTAAVFISGL